MPHDDRACSYLFASRKYFPFLPTGHWVDGLITKGKRPLRESWVDGIAHGLAVWFGCGHVPKAPGTAGTLGAIPLYLVIAPYGKATVAAVALLVTMVGIWAADRVAKRLHRKDPQIVCIDEVAGVLTTWIAAPQTWTGLLVGLVLFRLFDHLKPWPARSAERRLPGGFGIVLDDIAAGLWGAAILLGAQALGIL